MIDSRLALTSALIAAGLTLSGCGQYGMKGDRGLPPPSETMAYPNINQVPDPHAGRPTKTASDQDALKAKLLASRPRTARSPRPFTSEQALREQRARSDRTAPTP